MNNVPIDGPTAGRVRSAIDDVQAGLVDAVAGVDAMIASLSAHRAELIARAHRWAQVTVDQVVPAGQAPARRTELAERSFAAEIGCALRISERTARQLIADSDTIVSVLPATFTALAAGKLGWAQARVIIDETCGLEPEDRLELESVVINAAAAQIPSRLRVRVRRARERLHPETITTRLKAAVADRSMSTGMAADGMGWLSLYAQAALIAGIDDRVSQVATSMRNNGDRHTMTQLRADITAMLLLGDGSGLCTDIRTDIRTDTNVETTTDASAGTDGAGPTAAADEQANTGQASSETAPPAPRSAGHTPSGSAMEPLAVLLSQVRPEMDVSVPVLTLLGVSEMPGSLNGVVPIDADTARCLAAAAPSFTRVLTDPETGVVLSVGRKRYRPPPDLARYIRLRDGTCRFPGCNRRARYTDIDHTVQWQDGAPTSSDNLACLCKKHHHLKDETVWRVIQLTGGVLQWTSPTGRVYTTEPQLELPVRDRGEFKTAVDAADRSADSDTDLDNAVADEAAPF